MNAQAKPQQRRKTHQQRSPLMGVKHFTATPDGVVVGRRQPRWNRQTGAWEGRTVEFGDHRSPKGLAEKPWLHRCPLVEDIEYDGVYMSDQSYYRLYLEQYARHMTWLYHEKVKERQLFAGLPKHRCSPGTYVPAAVTIRKWVVDATKALTAAIESQHGFKMNEFDPEALELDSILIDESEAIRDSARRYGRSGKTRKGAGRS